MILALLLCAFAAPQDAPVPELRLGVAALKDAEKIFALGNPEQARVLVERAITEMFAARPEALDVEDDRALRDAGALAYKLRSMEPARRAWDAVRRFREKTLDPTSMELQNARGNVSWIGEQMGLVAEARAFEEQILEVLEKTLPPDHDALQTARGNLGDTLLQQGEFSRAANLFQAIVEVRRAKLPAEHPQRLRAELDRACGFVGMREPHAAALVLADVLAACPSENAPIRLRWAGEASWTEATGEGMFMGALYLAQEIRGSRAQIRNLPWRQAESRFAELEPFIDLMLSTVVRLEEFPEAAKQVEPVIDALAELGRMRPSAVFHRWERSRVEGDGGERRVLADERLGVAVFVDVQTSRWIDLGSLASARALVQAWDDAAHTGDAAKERDAVASALFVPVVKAVGGVERIAIVPDDVIWAVPLDALELRTEKGAVVTFEVSLPAPRPSEPLPTGPWAVLGDPAPTSESARKQSLAAGPDAGGAASAYVSSLRPSTKDATLAWGRRLGVDPVRGDDASATRFAALSTSSAGIVLAAPIWSAPDDVPCITTPRPIVASTPLAAVMSREDVFGGSSPADLCGFLFADHSGKPGENARVPAAPRAADLRDPYVSSARRLVVASPPPRADVVVRARDIEALARALVDAGFVDVCFATQPIRDVERVSFPLELEEVIPRATPVPESVVRGPWLRVRAIP